MSAARNGDGGTSQTARMTRMGAGDARNAETTVNSTAFIQMHGGNCDDDDYKQIIYYEIRI